MRDGAKREPAAVYAGGVAWVDEAYDTRLTLTDQKSGRQGGAELSDTVTPSIDRRGRLPAAWWDDLWIEICRALHEGDLKPKRQGDIEKAMHEWASMQGHSPATSTIRARARKLWDAISDEDD